MFQYWYLGPRVATFPSYNNHRFHWIDPTLTFDRDADEDKLCCSVNWLSKEDLLSGGDMLWVITDVIGTIIVSSKQLPPTRIIMRFFKEKMIIVILCFPPETGSWGMTRSRMAVPKHHPCLKLWSGPTFFLTWWLNRRNFSTLAGSLWPKAINLH